MSARLGLAARRGSRAQPQFLGVMGPDRDYSEATAREIDLEVDRVIAEAYERAKDVLRQRRQALERIVEVLVAREVMDGDELRALLREHDGAGTGPADGPPAEPRTAPAGAVEAGAGTSARPAPAATRDAESAAAVPDAEAGADGTP